jgi:hypothetical protein
VKAASETALVATVLDYLAVRQVFCWRSNNVGTRRTARDGRQFWHFTGLRGVSDIVGVLEGGRLLAIEVKRPGGKLTDEQSWFIDEVNRRGGLALVIRDVGQLDQALRAEGVVA